ncbi:hypothetical protein GGE65_005960 [Skermanella aerolata]|uniref:DUF4394 domain-containing protein n=1 Tax=Skermanella aerolata TaxID=393310 RepID=UPI003D201DE8
MKIFSLLTAVSLIALPGVAKADTVAVLMGGDTLALVDTAASAVTRTMTIPNAAGPLVGIDVRPADGQLYALSANGTVHVIDLASGTSTVKSKLDTALPSAAGLAVDFNPVADRLRVIGSDGTNLRINVDDGKAVTDGRLRFADGDAHSGKTPQVVAGAYTNSHRQSKETVLYDIDAANGALLKQVPPNDGVLNTVGGTGLKAVGGFDIQSDGAGGNVGWLMSGTSLYRIDLLTGKTTEASTIKGLTGEIRDLAVLMPAQMPGQM